MTEDAEDMEGTAMEDWRERFIGSDGSDPAVRLMLGMERLLLAPTIRAHPRSSPAHLDGGSADGRAEILGLAGVLGRAGNRRRNRMSILGSWSLSSNPWVCSPPEVGIPRADRNGTCGGGDGRPKTQLERMAVFAMLNRGWAEGMAGIVDDPRNDDEREWKRTAHLARMVEKVFLGRWPDARAQSPEDVCAGMVLGFDPDDTPGMPGALASMGMGTAPSTRHVSAMLDLLSDGLTDDMRMAAATSPMFVSGHGCDSKTFMRMRDEATSVIEDTGATVPTGIFRRCGWRVMRAILDGTLPPRIVSLTAGTSIMRGTLFHGMECAMACDRAARMDLSSPDPERMESILRATVPSVSRVGASAEDILGCVLHNDSAVIGEESGKGVALLCAMSGDEAGVSAINALWDLLYVVAPAMDGAGSDDDRGVSKWPILPGTVVAEAIGWFASGSMPDGFIAQTLAASTETGGDSCGIRVHPNNIRNGEGEKRYLWIRIDWSR